MTTPPVVPNVLAQRYASPRMRHLWSPEHKIVLERQLWLAVLKAQKELGVEVPEQAIAAYESVLDHVDLEAIRRREQRTRHDVKARIEEFCELAGYELIHRGMTSRDLTENVEQLQTKQALTLIRDKCVAVLARLAALSEEHSAVPLAGRSHNVAAQVTTLGKRFANAGQELLVAMSALGALLEGYPLRGIKGPVGTQQDQLDVLGSAQRVDELEQRVADHLGFRNVLSNVGQVYPRSLDLQVVSTLRQIASGPASLAKTLRLMAGQELASEGFQEGQVGSSAMPHKMNARSCERIGGFCAILTGHLNMVAALAGDQWNEGDVSCSVVRRVALPDSHFALDGLLEASLHVLNDFTAFPGAIHKELQRYLPFLSATKLLMACVAAGVGREQAHSLIQKHALAVADDMRRGRISENDLLSRLASDPAVPLDASQLDQLLGDPISLSGNARRQGLSFQQQVETLIQAHPDAAHYQPGALL